MCPELPAARARCSTPTLKPQRWKTIQRQSYQQCHTESCPRPPLALTGPQYQFVVLPVMVSDQPKLEAALVARQVLFACFLILMSQSLDPRQDYRGKQLEQCSLGAFRAQTQAEAHCAVTSAQRTSPECGRHQHRVFPPTLEIHGNNTDYNRGGKRSLVASGCLSYFKLCFPGKTLLVGQL